MITEQDLRNYRKLKLQVDDLEESIEKLERQLTSAKVQLPKMNASSGKKRTLEDNIDRLDTLKGDYIKKVNKLLKKIFHIEEFINSLEDPTTELIFKLRYIEGMEWEPICVKVHYRWRKVHSLHREILDKIKEENEKEHPVHTIS